ncbi:ABC transporter ATP-binding protein [Sedimentibacter sp. zth1]|uniref:ABC transporter ATP-binding protein n=1 Tax=Sedimentibacter sp. zth1 TaxID=2816908 RepID=UPI001A927BBE|nr:ABC transporter ATP-binding protein [Sedimentibacter sp. zth1]QSX04827.1 ABC transporter ATP-binding protein [Sedimentibacter sp. zth1]
MKKILMKIYIFILVVINSLSTVLFALSFIGIIDNLTKNNFILFRKNLIFLICIVVFQIITGYIYSRQKNKYVAHTVISLKSRLSEKIFALSITSFNKKEIGEYISFLFNDINMLEKNYIMPKFELLEKIVLVVLSITGIIIINPLYLIVLVVILALSVLIPFALMKKVEIRSKHVSKNNELATTKYLEILNGFKIIKHWNLENKFLSESNDYVKKMEYSKLSLNNYSILVNSSLQFMLNFLIVAVFGLGGILVSKNLITVGMIFALTNLITNVTNPFMSLMMLFNQIKSVKYIKDKCNKILSEEYVEGKHLFKSEEFNSLQLKNVSFSYPTSEIETLNDINYTFEKGKKYAIVGKNGSGKSTIVKILAKVLDNYTGNIYFNNTLLNEIDEKDYFNRIGYIDQDLYLFNKSIEENIFIKGKENTSVNEEIKDNLYDVFNIDKINYDCSNLSEENNNSKSLSGGEKQKIIIIRELLKNIDILLADEPNSALDKKTSKNLIETFVNIEPLTVIMITHTINEDLKKFDKILVIEDGTIEECGTYEELLLNKEYFHEHEQVNANELNS